MVYADIRGVPHEGRQLLNDSNAYPVTINFKMYLLTIYGQYHVNNRHVRLLTFFVNRRFVAIFVVDRTFLRKFE